MYSTSCYKERLNFENTLYRYQGEKKIDYAIVNEETWERVGKFRIEEREYTRTISKWLRGSKGRERTEKERGGGYG
jgi:hypothetical protein